MDKEKIIVQISLKDFDDLRDDSTELNKYKSILTNGLAYIDLVTSEEAIIKIHKDRLEEFLWDLFKYKGDIEFLEKENIKFIYEENK